MSPTTSSRIFLLAAIFNWSFALGLFLMPAPFLGLFAVSPAPEQSLWVQQFAGLVFFFGVGYYQASINLEKMAPMIRLAVWAKCSVLAVALLNVLTGDISWQFIVPASADGVFAVLFVQALRTVDKR